MKSNKLLPQIDDLVAMGRHALSTPQSWIIAMNSVSYPKFPVVCVWGVLLQQSGVK